MLQDKLNLPATPERPVLWGGRGEGAGEEFTWAWLTAAAEEPGLFAGGAFQCDVAALCP